MCDRCGAIFSERDTGWETYQGNRVVRDPDGGNHAVRMQLDSCAECASGGSADGPVRPRLAGPAAGDERIIDVRTRR